ncbi:MAG: hypothetical protein IJ179_11110 [Oscillospiraceae bacterium]|nr:hypothetical protein [Oscillospiraceae bacterium]
MSDQKKGISYRLLFCLLLAALLPSLVPLLMVGRFAVPCADDFSYGAAAHAAFGEAGSVLSALAAGLAQVKATYFGWQGTFSAVFLMSVQPAVFGTQYYFFTPLLMLLSLLCGGFCLCPALFSGVFGLPRALSGCIAAVCALLCIQLVPSPVQAFFWYNGAVYYTFFYGLALLAFALGLRLCRLGGVGRMILLCLLTAVLGGGNYVTALSCSIVAISSILLLAVLKNGAWKRLLPPTLCLLIAFVISMAAPGNAVRQSALDNTPNAVWAVLQSFRWAAVYSARWFHLPLAGALVFLGVLLWPALKGTGRAFRFPALVTVYSYCLLSAMFCPGLYAMGTAGDQRLINIIYYAYVLLLVINLVYWLGWIAARKQARPGLAGQAALWPTLASGAACLLCCLLFVRSGGFTSLMALGAMRSGEAQAYHAAAGDRFALLEDAAVRDAVLEPFPCQPYVLYMDDVTTDPQDWRNLAMATYYNKDSVVLYSGS